MVDYWKQQPGSADIDVGGAYKSLVSGAALKSSNTVIKVV